LASARLSVRAEVDAAIVALEIAERNPVRAAAFYARLDYALSLLADFPRIGRSRPDLGVGHYSFLLDGRLDVGLFDCTGRVHRPARAARSYPLTS
jgi:plasmid stabilization system protein ParE